VEVVKQMESLTEKLAPPAHRDIDSASLHHWALVKGLERTVTTFGRAQRYTAALFPREIERINSHLTRVSRLLVELEGEIGKRRKELEEIWFSLELVAKIQAEQSAVHDLSGRVMIDEERLAGLSASSVRLEAEQRRTSESIDGRRSEDLKRSLDQSREDLGRVEAEMADLVTPLSKALARIMKQGANDRLSLRHRDVFLQLLESPARIPDKEIHGSLQELRSHLASLGLKDRKKEKTLEHIDLLIGRRSLESAKSRRFALEDQIRGLETDLSMSSREALDLKEEQSRLRKAIKSLEADLDQSRQELAATKEEVARDESELCDRLSRLAKKPVQVDPSSGETVL
jgi:chromosome segregation ATPase